MKVEFGDETVANELMLGYEWVKSFHLLFLFCDHSKAELSGSFFLLLSQLRLMQSIGHLHHQFSFLLEAFVLLETCCLFQWD